MKRCELKALIGQEVGVSDWFSIDQKGTDAFAGLTYDTPLSMWTRTGRGKRRWAALLSMVSE